MRIFMWAVMLASAAWASAVCLILLLSRVAASWVPPLLAPVGEYVTEPSLFAALVGLPTLACLGSQIWQVQRVDFKQ